MPTGYTAAIAEGITFKEYAMNCARAFGALIHMRDDPQDAPIPKTLPKDSYHQTALDNTIQELNDFKNLSKKNKRLMFFKHKRDTRAYAKETYLKKKKLHLQYRKMLVEVNRYVPPSPDHFNFKNFMKEQIIGSIDFDCKDYGKYYSNTLKKLKNLTQQEWELDTIKHIEWSIEYHKKELQEENERNNGRQEWIDQLRESLQEI